MSDIDRPFVDKKRYDELGRGDFLRIAEEQARSEGACLVATARKIPATATTNPNMKAEIADALREALNGSRQVEITFKHNAIQDILFLFGMLSPFNLRIEDAHTIILESAVESGEWEHDNNRTVVVTLLQNFDQSWFIDRMGRALENISAVPKKP